MRVNVVGRHMSLSDAVRDYCTQKAEKLGRFYDRIQSIDVVLDGHDGDHAAEIIVHTDGTSPFVASEHNSDMFAAVDLLMDKIEVQIRRYKERHRNRKHPH